MRDLHESLQFGDYYSTFHLDNQNDYEYANDELFNRYGFLINEDEFHDYSFPDSPSDRYDLFLESTCRYYLNENTLNYKNLMLVSGDIKLMNGLKHDLEKIIFHPRLTKSKNTDNMLYYEARRFFNDVYIDPSSSNKNGFGKYTEEEVTLFLYSLHAQDYFKILPLPDNAFQVDCSLKKYYAIGQVVGKYELFYKHLLFEISNKSQPSYNAKVTTLKAIESTLQKKDEVPPCRLKDMLLPEHRDKYDIIVRFLSNENPYDDLKKLARKNGFTSPLPTFDKFDMPIFVPNEEPIFDLRINPNYTAKKSIAASLILCMVDKYYFRQLGISKLHLVANLTFNVNMDKHNLFCSLNSNRKHDVYMLFFKSLLDNLFT